MSDPLNFGDLLQELRVDRGLSQEELAADARVSVRAISDLERGVTRRPHRDTIRALAVALDLASADRDRFERLARRTPPVRAPRPRPVQVELPSPATPLVGREAEATALLRLLRGPDVRLVTIIGFGGVGKTRLATEVAWRSTASFAGVHLVDLTGLRVADQVPTAVAAAFRLPGFSVTSMAALTARLPEIGARLLVIDGAEHVTDLARDIAALLTACADLTILATSRTPLRLRGEHRWPLAPLPVPASDASDASDVDDVDDVDEASDVDDQNPALELLVTRTRAVRPGFAVTAANREPLAALCRRLDGVPLAIELAAARLRTREPADLLAELGSQLTGLQTDAVDVPDRQQSLHATVAWTLRLLRDPERRLMAALCAFTGGAAITRLRAVLQQAEVAVDDLNPTIALLADAQLVAVVDRAGQARLTMLDTIREVAADLLGEDGAPARAAHTAVFLELVRSAESATGIDAELDNVRAAIDRALADDPSLVDVELTVALTRYFRERGSYAEAYRVLQAIADRSTDPLTRAQAWVGAGIAANENGDPSSAVRLAGLAAAAFAAADDSDPVGRCTALSLLGNAFKALGEYGQARTAHEECLALARTLADPRPLTVALNNLGTVAEDLGDYDTARANYAESLAVKERSGDDRGVAVAYNNLGGLAAELGDYRTARDHLERACRQFRALGQRHTLSFGLAMLSQACLGAGDVAAARAAAEEALPMARAVDFGHAVGLALARLGDLARAGGDHDHARDLYEQALAQPFGLPETIRTLERLAAATANGQPRAGSIERARRLLDEATGLRAKHGLPPSPTAQQVIDEVQGYFRP